MKRIFDLYKLSGENIMGKNFFKPLLIFCIALNCIRVNGQSELENAYYFTAGIPDVCSCSVTEAYMIMNQGGRRDTIECKYTTSKVFFQMGYFSFLSVINSSCGSNSLNSTYTKGQYTNYITISVGSCTAAQMQVLVDDPIVITSCPSSLNLTQASTITLGYGAYYNNNKQQILQYKVGSGAWTTYSGATVSGNGYSQINVLSILGSCNHEAWQNGYIYFRALKTLNNGTVTYGNIVSTRVYDIPRVAIPAGGGSMACAGNTITITSVYQQATSCNTYATLEASLDKSSWQSVPATWITNASGVAEANISYADIYGANTSNCGKEIWIRANKNGITGNYVCIVFLPVIQNIIITPHPPTCAGGTDAYFTLTFTDVPETGCKDPNGGKVPLIITIKQYSEYKLADDVTYSIKNDFGDGKTYYYHDGATILGDFSLEDKNWIKIGNAEIPSNFKLESGKYVITTKLNNGSLSCEKELTKDFTTPFPFKTTASAQSILVKDGNTYHVKTGNSQARVKFTFEGGTPPYKVNLNDAGGTLLATYNQAGEYYLDVTTDQAEETKRTYYISDANTCPGSGSYDVSFYRPANVSVTDPTPTSPDCNQSDETGTKNNGKVSVTIGGGVPGYTAELWSGSDSLMSKPVSLAGTVTFSNSDYPITARKYQIKIRDYLNSQKSWPSEEIEVKAPPALTITAIPTHPTCNYLNNGSLILSGGGGNGTYQYTVTKGGSSVTNYSGTLSDGVYSITVTNTNLCTKTTTATLLDPPALSLTATYSKPASCAMVNNGIVRAEVGNYRNTYSNVSFSDEAGFPLSAAYSGSGDIFTITGLSDTARMEIIVNDSYCQASDSVKIPLRNSPLTINTNTTNEAPCTGKDGTITVSAENGELPVGTKYKFYADGGTLKESVTPSETFTLLGNSWHNFKLIDGVGCTVSQLDKIGVRTDSLRLNKLAGVTDTWCKASNSGRITIQKASGTGMIDFQITPTDSLKKNITQVTFYNLYPKTYTILATDLYGCTDVANVTVAVRNDSLALVSVNTIKAVCKESSPTGELKVSRYVSGKKTGYGDVSYTLQTKTQADSTFKDLRSGWYTIKATDEKGCSVNISDSVKFETNPVLLDTLFVNHQTCNEVQNAKIKLIAATKPGTDPLYRFVFGEDTTAWRQDTITYRLNTAGTYTFRVIDKNNCGTSRTETIKNLKYAPKPILEYSLPVACANAVNGELKVYNLPHHSQPKYRYILGSDVAYTTSADERVIFSGLKKGSHIVTIRDTLGCQDTAKFTVNIESDSVHIATINTTSATCIAAQNGQAKIVASSFDKSATANKYTFECNNKTMYGDSVTFTGLPVSKTGLYLVKVTDRYGCRNTGNFAINVLKDTLNLEFRALEDAACPGSSDGWMKLRRSFGNEKFRYSLLSGTGYSRVFELNDTLVSINNLPYGTYTITVKDTNKCVARVENIEINQPDTIRFLSFYNNYVKRKGEPEGILSASIWKGNGKYDYEWYNLEKNTLVGKGKTLENTKVQIDNLYAGSYLLKVRDTANCFVSPAGWLEKQFTIVEPEKALELSIVSNKAVSCYGLNDGAFSVKATGGWGENYLYGLDAEHMDVYGSFTGHAAKTLAAFAKDTSGVIVSIPVIISQPEPLTATFSQKTDANCFGSSDGAIRTNISGGNYPHYFVSADNLYWTKGNTLSGLSKGSYTVYVRDTLHCNTTLPIPVAIDQPSEIKVLSSKITNTRCMFANGAITAEIGGGIPGYTFLWYDEQGNKVPGDGSNSANLYSGTYRLNATDNHNCLKVFPFNVSDITDLTIDRVDTVSVSCWGYSDGKASISVSKGNPPYTITWPDSSHSTTVTGLQSGDYTVRVDDKERCKVFRNFVIGSPSRIMLESKTIIPPYCEGVEDGKIAINATGSFGGYSYLWSNGKKENSISKLRPGTYKLTITDSHNCFNNFDFALDYQHTIKPSLGYDRNLCNGNSLWLTPGEYITYKWGSSTGVSSSEPGINVNNAGSYFVEIADYENCIGRDTINIGLSSTEMEGKLLVATNVAQNDTLILFQASWPMPDSVKFHMQGCRIIETGQYYRKVVFADTGTYTVALTSYLNDCEDRVMKTVQVEEAETKLKKSTTRLILAFNVSPNPSNGQFNVEIQLRETADIQLRLVNLGTGIVSDIRSYKGLAAYYFPYNLNLPSGTYMLHLQCEKDAKSKTLLIIR